MRSNFSLNKRENNKIPILKTVRWANCRGIQFIDNEGELLTLLFPLRIASAEHCYSSWRSFYLTYNTLEQSRYETNKWAVYSDVLQKYYDWELISSIHLPELFEAIWCYSMSAEEYVTAEQIQYPPHRYTYMNILNERRGVFFIKSLNCYEIFHFDRMIGSGPTVWLDGCRQTYDVHYQMFEVYAIFLRKNTNVLPNCLPPN